MAEKYPPVNYIPLNNFAEQPVVQETRAYNAFSVAEAYRELRKKKSL